MSRYGWIFLFETYLYHVVRQDIRHNFSPYFYLLYLTNLTRQNSLALKLFYFMPQLVSILVTSCALYKHIELCFLVLTVLFVSFNKVCTSQVIFLNLKSYLFQINLINLIYLSILYGICVCYQSFYQS